MTIELHTAFVPLSSYDTESVSLCSYVTSPVCAVVVV